MQTVQELIDEQTGEIFEIENPTIDDLARICRALRATEAHQRMTEQYLKDEIDRLSSFCQAKLDSLAAQHTHLSGIAEGLLRSSGKERLEYPGLGVVRFGQTKESVDTTGYDELSLKDQKDIQVSYPELFNTTVKVLPGKKAIATAIKGLNGELEDGPPLSESAINALVNTDLFKLRPKRETFVFKAEM